MALFVFTVGVASSAALGDAGPATTSTTGTTEASTTAPVPDIQLAPFASKRRTARLAAHHAATSRCRSHERLHFRHWARDIRVDRRQENLSKWRERRDRQRAKTSKCLPTDPAAIIRYVFPAGTEDAAIRVATCESNLYVYAHNASGASGLFQLMPFWWQGKFDPYNPWANTRAAYSISSGGTNWGAWVCQP